MGSGLAEVTVADFDNDLYKLVSPPRLSAQKYFFDLLKIFLAIFQNMKLCPSSPSAQASGNVLSNFRLSTSWFEEILQADLANKDKGYTTVPILHTSE